MSEPVPSLPDTPAPGTEFGDYRLIRELGRGGMAVVFEAEEIGLQRRVALKVFHPRFDRTLVDCQRFRREAEAGSKLQHPAVVRVFRRGVHDGVPFIASELVADGRNMDQLCEQWKKDPASRPVEHVRMVAEWFANIAEAMAEAHHKGILHRDLKPANLLVSGDGRPFVADFGLAWMDDRRGLSQSGEMVGTPFFMSPEQVASGSLSTSERADVYSLGASLYQMLTLQRPFEASQAEQVFHRILHHEPTHPRKIQPKLPLDLVQICLKAMDRSPQRRYASMADFADDLRRFLRYEPVLAKAPTVFHRFRRWQERHPASFVAVLLLAVMATILIRGGQILAGSDEAKKRAEVGWSQTRLDRFDILMRAADEAIHGFRFDDADDLLGLCEGPLQNWPWRHAKRRLARHWSTLRQPGGPRLLTLAVHPEGKFVVGGFGNGSVQLWSVESGQMVRELGRFTLGVYATAFSPDGHYVAAAGDNAEVHVFDTESLELTATYQGHWAGVGCVVFGPQSNWLASCDDAGEVHIWELAQGTTMAKAKVPPRAVFMDVSADGKRLAVADGEHGVHVLSTSSGLPITQPLHAHTEIVYDLRFLEDGRHLATAGADQMLHIWDVSGDGEWVAGGNAAQSALNSLELLGARRFLVGDKAGKVSEVEWLENNQLRTNEQWPAHFAFANVVRRIPACSLIVTGGDDGAVHIWQPEGNSASLLKPQTAAVAQKAAFSDSAVMAVASADGELQVWNKETGQPFANFLDGAAPVHALALSADGQQVATLTQDGELWLTATATGLRRRMGMEVGDLEPLEDRTPGRLAFSPDGRQLLLVANQRRFLLFDTATGKQRQWGENLMSALHIRDPLLGLHWDSSNRIWLLRERGLEVRNAAARGWPVLKTYANGDAALASTPRFLVARANDFRLSGLAVACKTGIALFHSSATSLPDEEQVEWLTVDTNGLSAMAWHGSERTLAGGFDDGEIRVWNTRSSGECSVWQGHSQRVHAMRFTGESDWLLSAAGDGSLQFWGTQQSPWPLR